MRLEWSETVAKERLKRMGWFGLLELIYQLKKSNEELTLRCREAEKQLDTLTRESTQREEKVRREYEQRIDELRMQGSAKDLQKRMKLIEQQLLSFQQKPEQDSEETTEEPSIPTAREADPQKRDKNIPQEDGE